MNYLHRAMALFVLFWSGSMSASGSDLNTYVTVIQERGVAPVDYVVDKLETHDLVIFDDFNHQAREPFDFYRQLVQSRDFQAQEPVIFVELFKINEQPHIDAFLAAPEKDMALLYPVFRATYSPYAYPMKSYFDLMETIYEVNRGLPEEKRLKVVATSTPSLWPSIENAADYSAAQMSLLGRDHDMYRAILAGLNEFAEGRKGVFLTNTRHAYTGVRKKDGSYFWNTGTFFRQWHPGKSFSVRMHGPQLFIEAVVESADTRDQEGLSRKKYYWGRMEKGLWDSAFATNGNTPVGFDLAGTPFGAAPYAGNHMLDAAPGQTMLDAYDGLLFLKPLEDLTATAKVDGLYDDAFVSEVARRLRIYRTQDELKTMMEKASVATLEDYVRAQTRPVEAAPLLPMGTLGPVDAWKVDED